MLCQTSKVLLGKLKSYKTMQGLVFSFACGEILHKMAISFGANWRISFGGTDAKNSLVLRNRQCLDDTSNSNFFSLAGFFFNTILRYLLEMSFQTHPPRLGWSSKVLGLPDWAWWRHNHLNFGAFFGNVGSLQRLTTLEKNVGWQNKQSNVENGQKVVFFTHSMQFLD